jgi:hypothetical protein
VNISLPFAKFNAFHRTNIIQLTTSVSSKLNIVCIKCKVKNHWYLQQRCPNSYMHRVEFYSHVKTKFAWSRLLLRWDYMFTTTSFTPQQLIKVPVQCHNSARPCTCIYIYDKILKMFWQCGILLFSYFNSVPLHATGESWIVSHHEGYLYISHYRHIEENIYHYEIHLYTSHAPLTSDTTTVDLRVKSRLTKENVIMFYLLTLQSKRKDRRYQRRNQSRKSDRQYNDQEKSEP